MYGIEVCLVANFDSCRLEINNSAISFNIGIWIQIEAEKEKNSEQMVYIYHLDSVFINHKADARARVLKHSLTICKKGKMELDMGTVSIFTFFFFFFYCRQKKWK